MFRRIVNLFRGFLGLFIGGVERSNPEALLDVEKENLRKQISRYNEGLAQHAGLCEQLMSRVRRLEAEEKDSRAKTTAHLNAGNRDAAGQFALRLQTVQSELAENCAQVKQAEKTYKDLLKARDIAVQTAQAKIETLKSGITDLKIKKATAELAEMASGMISALGGRGTP
jgi:phage shock protein A